MKPLLALFVCAVLPAQEPTERERQLLEYAALGLTNKEIAYDVGVSASTVRVLLARAAKKLGVLSRDQLIAAYEAARAAREISVMAWNYHDDDLPAPAASVRREIGYSLRYALKGKGGTVLDTGWAALKLYPPGREDFFRLITPHAFNVRYLPDATDGRVLAVRISRNKDLLFSDRVKLGEDVPFDNGLISFADVRMWGRIHLAVDRGEPVTTAGLVLLFIGWAMRSLRRRTRGVRSV